MDGGRVGGSRREAAGGRVLLGFRDTVEVLTRLTASVLALAVALDSVPAHPGGLVAAQRRRGEGSESAPRVAYEFDTLTARPVSCWTYVVIASFASVVNFVE